MKRILAILAGILISAGLTFLPLTVVMDGAALPMHLAYGRTSTNVNVPILVASDGSVKTSGGGVTTAAQVIALWSGTCNSSTVLGGNGVCQAISSAFSAITGATNTTAAMVVGTGASLATSGSGTIAATSLTGAATGVSLATTSFLSSTQSIAAVSTDGLLLTNTMAAAAGAQQWSPRAHWMAQGWKTTSTAASQTVDMIAELQPVQGSTSPTANFVFSSQINGAGYVAAATITDTGKVIAKTQTGVSFGFSGNLTSGLEDDTFNNVYIRTANIRTFKVTSVGVISAVSLGLVDAATPHLSLSGKTPTISSGFGSGAAIAGIASSFRVTAGTTPGVGGTIAFNDTFTNIPVCFVQDETTGVLGISAPTATTVVISGLTLISGQTVTVHCTGY